MKYARGNCRYTLDKKMGGRISKELELQRRRDDEKYARDVLLDGEISNFERGFNFLDCESYRLLCLSESRQRKRSASEFAAACIQR
jgi:hypothetical protein